MFGLFVQRHAEAVALFNEVTAIYIHPDENAKSTFELERSRENGVDTIRVYYKKTGKLTSALRYFKACRKALKLAGKPDLIHVHVLTRMGVVAYLEKLLHGTPYIITEHWSRYLPGNDFSGVLRKIATKIVVRNAAMVTTVTENLAQAMQAHGLHNDRYVTLPNVVDFGLFQPKPHHNDFPKIAHVSCFEDKSKNISGLLESLKILKDKGIPYQAVLIGEGMDLEAMKLKANALELNDRVLFTGLLQGQDLTDTLASCDFLVLSSNYENMPVVILEALACGLPVVSTRVGGIAEIVNESNGILVPPANAQALAAAMEQCCNTYKEYDPEKLRAQVMERYDTKQVGKLLNDWYQEVIHPRCSS
jgi:glycosyltransferase involved in cell wall biosynthesis